MDGTCPLQVYLVMDYQSGGELFSYLREQGTFTEVGSRGHYSRRLPSFTLTGA